MTAAPSATQRTCSAVGVAHLLGVGRVRCVRIVADDHDPRARSPGADRAAALDEVERALAWLDPADEADDGTVACADRRPRRRGVGDVELDRAVDDVRAQAREALGDGAGVGQHGVGERPVARHAIDDVVDVQHAVAAGQRGQQAAADRAVEVDEVVPRASRRARGKLARARAPAPRSRPPSARRTTGRPGSSIGPGGRRRERQLVPAREQPLREPQQPDLGAARMGDGTYREDPHGPILAGRGRCETWQW